jgi:hypothetical protein
MSNERSSDARRWMRKGIIIRKMVGNIVAR